MAIPDDEQKMITKRTWGSTPAGSIFAKDMRPGTRDFFDRTLKVRNEYEIPWITEIIPFSSFRNRKIIEIGCGSGYDAFLFCKNGADYTGIDITPENIARAKAHLAFYGYQPNIAEGDAENLQFAEGCFDVAFSNGVLHHTPDIRKSFREVHRVLKPDGEFWVALYHKHSVFYWITLMLSEHLLKLGFLRRSFRERLAMIEYTTSGELPLVTVYSRKSLKILLEKTGFNVQTVWVRRLIKEELPALPLLGRLWPFIPQPWLDRAGKAFGWYIIAKATKAADR